MSLYQMFFKIELNLCERFPSLTPFQIRREKAGEVFLLIKRLNEYNMSLNNENTRKNGKRVIRRRANDNWF